MPRPPFAGVWLPASPSRWTPFLVRPKCSPRRSAKCPAASSPSRSMPAGELMPAFGVVDGVQNGTVEMAHTAPYYFFGKDQTFALGCAIPFGLNSRQMTAWMYEGNGLQADARVLRQVQHHELPDGQHRRPDGRLVPQGNQVRRRPQGPEVPRGRLRRQGAGAHGRRAAEHSWRRDLPGAGKRHDRCGRVGRPVRRPETGLQQGGAVLLLPRLVGRRPAARVFVNQQGL